MANNERMIFGIGFDLATGVDAVIKEWEGKESKRLQKGIDKNGNHKYSHRFNRKTGSNAYN